MNQSDFQVMITTSRSLVKLKRCYESCKLSFENVYININSLDDSFIEESKEYCISNNIPYSITESNGYPGKGKNASMNIAYDQGRTWNIFVDGDDFLGPNIYTRIEKLILNKPETHIGIMVDDNIYYEYKGVPIPSMYRIGARSMNNYYTNRLLYRKVNLGALGTDIRSRIFLFHRSVLRGTEIQHDETVKGFEDMQSILNYKHLARQGEINLTSFTGSGIYYYDISDDETDHSKALFQKPEEFAQNLVKYFRRLSGKTNVAYNLETTVQVI